jgi:hypothetical protein
MLIFTEGTTNSVDEEELTEENLISKDEIMRSKFFEEVQRHKMSMNKDRDIAIFTRRGYNFVGYLIVW